MYLSLVLISTNVPNPNIMVLDRSISSVDRLQTKLVKQKILSVDLHPEGTIPEQFFQKFSETGWHVVFGKGGGVGSQQRNHKRGVEQAEHSWTLTCEDDTFLERLPNDDVMLSMKEHDISFLCYNACFCDRLEENNHAKNYINGYKSYIRSEDFWFLPKKIEWYPRYHVNFPALLAPTTHLMAMHSHMECYCKDAFECCMTKAWRYLYPETKVAIFLKPIAGGKPVNQQTLHDHAWLKYRCNTPSLDHGRLMPKRTEVYKVC